MPEMVGTLSWFSISPSVVKCPSSASRICAAVQLTCGSGCAYQLSAYHPMINHTCFGPYSFCLYTCEHGQGALLNVAANRAREAALRMAANKNAYLAEHAPRHVLVEQPDDDPRVLPLREKNKNICQ